MKERERERERGGQGLEWFAKLNGAYFLIAIRLALSALNAISYTFTYIVMLTSQWAIKSKVYANIKYTISKLPSVFS